MNGPDSSPVFISEEEQVRSVNSVSSAMSRLNVNIAKYNILAHAFGFIVAVVFSLAALIVALVMITCSFFDERYDMDNAWAETTIAFVLGVWLTDRPKFAKKNSKKT